MSLLCSETVEQSDMYVACIVTSFSIRCSCLPISDILSVCVMNTSLEQLPLLLRCPFCCGTSLYRTVQ
jgi:hypothetical protein